MVYYIFKANTSGRNRCLASEYIRAFLRGAAPDRIERSLQTLPSSSIDQWVRQRLNTKMKWSLRKISGCNCRQLHQTWKGFAFIKRASSVTLENWHTIMC